MTKRQLETLSFDNSYARRPEAFYAKLNPTPFAAPPHLVSFNPAAAELIDLDPEQAKRPEFAGVFGGNLLVPGMEPLAMFYSGHQFGVYVPQLGDGRALLLGEVRGERGEKWDLHLKGAGLTPFSREGDGRAVLRLYGQHYKDCGPTLGRRSWPAAWDHAQRRNAVDLHPRHLRRLPGCGYTATLSLTVATSRTTHRARHA